MKPYIVATALIVAAAAAHAQVPQKSAAECSVKLSKYLDMSFTEFDQTMGAGWREVKDKPGCEIAAADLIAQYRERMLDNANGLYWHEAQGRAIAGQTDKALELFRRDLAYEKSKPDGDRADTNILKAEATIAFLEGDLDGVRAARAKLIALPKPDGFDLGIQKFKEKYPDLSPPTWPLNLRDFDAFITCFGKPYAEAYGDCRKDDASSKPAKP